MKYAIRSMFPYPFPLENNPFSFIQEAATFQEKGLMKRKFLDTFSKADLWKPQKKIDAP
ncbi:MAG: hypothetical protein JRI76_10580 [Deltaproteobacteria bacterium]|nr:hypothetical protein [Deltaproteobacteria bacterium]MBW1955470.1 hypothetical protein [Deltaproteobacteria bacterium]MBW2042461.1 hypothetical protein [Deltaproteobacteria bacterium]MBW2132718.1 hypothetical protein [Deltaproteobacteria bacterium]